jgi:hypothetical protein
VIEAYANELMNRTNDHNKAEKLAVIETIALRMGWTKLYERLMNYRRENNQNLH